MLPYSSYAVPFPTLGDEPVLPLSFVFRVSQEELLESMDLAQYAVKGTEADWEAATKKTKGKNGTVGAVSIKSKVHHE